MTPDQEKCLFKVTNPSFQEGSVTHSEHFPVSLYLALVLTAFNASQRFLAALLL
nr:hypothetical protein [Salmonella enterica subsp. enterica serovar Dublin]